jgi:uncharacterized protein
VNQIKRLAEDVSPLPHVKRSSDPEDDSLLAMCEAGKADYLVTGSLRRHKGTRIISAINFGALFV